MERQLPFTSPPVPLLVAFGRLESIAAPLMQKQPKRLTKLHVVLEPSMCFQLCKAEHVCYGAFWTCWSSWPTDPSSPKAALREIYFLFLRGLPIFTFGDGGIHVLDIPSQARGTASPGLCPPPPDGGSGGRSAAWQNRP